MTAAGTPDRRVSDRLRVLGSSRNLLLLIVAVAAVLRFATLGAQNLWVDEALTLGLVDMSFADMLATLPDSEANPPLYYVAVWLWAKLFGAGEVGLRSLSALAGTAFVAVAYAAGRAFVSQRVGLITAAAAALSPPLVWYSQEARSYSLLVLAAGLSLLFFARALAGRRWALGWWAAASAAALATHYFAALLVVPEAAYLVWRLRPRGRGLLAACSVVGFVGAALFPLANYQRTHGNLERVTASPLRDRVESVGEVLAAGQTGALLPGAAVAMGVLVAIAAVVLLASWGPSERRALQAPLALCAAGFAVPVALALVGLDYVIARNFLPLWLPLAIVVATGLAARGARPAAALATAGILALSFALVLAVTVKPELQRERINAAVLKGESLRGRNTVRIAFERVAAGQASSLEARCPAGYAVSTGTAGWLRSRAPVGGLESGPRGSRWIGQTPAGPRSDDVLRVSVVCVEAGGRATDLPPHPASEGAKTRG